MEEKRYTAVTICRNPSTTILIDDSLPEEEKAKRINKYLQKNGKLKIDTVSEYELFTESNK